MDQHLVARQGTCHKILYRSYEEFERAQAANDVTNRRKRAGQGLARGSRTLEEPVNSPLARRVDDGVDFATIGRIHDEHASVALFLAIDFERYLRAAALDAIPGVRAGTVVLVNDDTYRMPSATNHPLEQNVEACWLARRTAEPRAAGLGICQDALD